SNGRSRSTSRNSKTCPVEFILVISADARRAKHRAKEPAMKILMVLTSHDKLGDTGRKTGFWLEELAAPYYEFKDSGAQISLASPKGGRPPLDPKSQDQDRRREAAGRGQEGDRVHRR